MTLLPANILEKLTAGSEQADRGTAWPIAAWEALRRAGALAWSIPREHGGAGLSAVELLSGLEDIASGCLTTAFALSQREAAIRHILKGPPPLRERYLPRLARGEIYMTVGLSQLTTSRQHQGPALRATLLPAGRVQLDGEIPWVTGADHATGIVVGATLPDATQLLLVLPTERVVDQIDPPLPLASLGGSRTSLVHCRQVIIEPTEILSGPAESILGKSGGGGLETSCLAIGLAAAAIGYLREEVAARPALDEMTSRFESTLQNLRLRLHELAGAADPDRTLSLRTDATWLVLRVTQAALMVAKGVGFVAPHPAQRWARQAQFFLVWSCPRPVADGVLAKLAGD
ncbi:MAG: acyl-CoA dehydrogenase [Planctomycetaceae bacterium]|nr:acyl-CoA dehydrogenase [Planctomycetaceae bacterium]